jgi:hypothetical protein
MPGRHVYGQLVRLYMRLRTTRQQPTAAVMTGISVATGRRIERDPQLPSSRGDGRDYRTRTDPLAELWDAEIVPLLEGAGDRGRFTLHCKRKPRSGSAC